jgi:hypothetical protein
MTIKDIEQMANELNGTEAYCIVAIAEGRITNVDLKPLNDLLKHIKENYNDDLTHKENNARKIERVRIWRRN